MNASLSHSHDKEWIVPIAVGEIVSSPHADAIYGAVDPEIESRTDGLLENIRSEGILVPLVVAPKAFQYQVVSGRRRLACARSLGLMTVPCVVRRFADDRSMLKAILDYNRQRRKTFRQLMREADTLEEILKTEAHARKLAGLNRGRNRAGAARLSVRRNFDEPKEAPATIDDNTIKIHPDDDSIGVENDLEGKSSVNRTDVTIAKAIGLGGKDVYRQARAVWLAAGSGDPRAIAACDRLDSGEQTIHAAYKDLRRRDRFTTGFKPTPYDVWAFRHDRSFGIPHPGSIPPAIIAHLLHYYSKPSDLVVDPMAGGGTTLDVACSMGRKCLVYDLEPVRPEIQRHDINLGFPDETRGCDLIFCDPPYHTMLARSYARKSIANAPLSEWLEFLDRLAKNALVVLKSGGYIALLLANQTEKDIPAQYGYLDHAFFGFQALLNNGFFPERRISCPMSGSYLPQDVARARRDGRMLGQTRDLLVMRKPLRD
jgi:ParB family chromosome partitioning protein